MAQLTVIFARVLQAIPTVFGIVVVTFLLTRALPGDPAAYFAGASATPESIAEIRAKLGLDQSLPVQFAGYIKDLATGNLGESISTGQPVATELLKRLPASLELTLFALLLSVVVSIPFAPMSHIHCTMVCPGAATLAVPLKFVASPWQIRAGFPAATKKEAVGGMHPTCAKSPEDKRTSAPMAKVFVTC